MAGQTATRINIKQSEQRNVTTVKTTLKEQLQAAVHKLYNAKNGHFHTNPNAITFTKQNCQPSPTNYITTPDVDQRNCKMKHDESLQNYCNQQQRERLTKTEHEY